MGVVKLTPAEERQRYRDIGGELPSDDILVYRYGDAITGAAEYNRSQGYTPPHSKTMAELSDEEFERVRAEVRRVE